MSTMNTIAQNLEQRPVAVITGGTQGLGYALAQVLWRQGFAVSTCARTKAAIETLKASVDSRYPLVAQVGDVTNPAFQCSFIEETVDAFGRIDALVNNASTLGLLPLPSVLHSTAANDRSVFETNVVAPNQLLRHALPHLEERRRSVIVGISSDAATGGYPGWGIYGASKAALDLLHKTLAAELSDRPVSVYSVDPGDMDTAMHRSVDSNADGLADPLTVAEALWPIFQPLVSEATFPFRSGTRLRVSRHGILEVTAS